MNTSKNDTMLDHALSNIEEKFRPKIIKHYLEVKRSLAEGRNEAVGLAAGKFCEVVIRVLEAKTLGKSTPFNKNISNFAGTCRKIIEAPAGSSPEAIRVVMPRALVFIYTVRNKRGVGHVGGDVDANRIDSMTIARCCDWVICELIRVYHSLSLEEAQDIVDGLSIRTMPDVWEVGDKKRVLKTGLNAKQKVLLLCHQSMGEPVLVEDLCNWIEYSNIGVLRSNILSRLHKDRFIEYDKETQTVVISPLGTAHVEETILSPEDIVAM